MKARVSDILTIAAEMACIDRAMILGNSKYRRFVRVRQACYLVAREQGYSYPFIGRLVNRDHTTVIHGADKALIIAERDQVFAAFLDQLRAAASDARPFVSNLGRRKVVPFKREPRIFDHPPTPDWLFDEVDLLSMRVAQHYAHQPHA